VWLKGMLGVGGAGALIFAVIMFIWARRMRGGFNDLRDQEGNVLGVINLVAGLVMLFFFFRVLGMNALPEWGARTVALVVQISAFAVKTIFWCWVFIWVRWSLPRFRYDQLMRLGWKNMIPLSFVNILLTGLVLILMGS
jgi:NADH-quinone oxidoreductase subunit H